MNTKIKLMFKEKDVYGRPLFYPENEEAKTVTAITGKKTLSKEQLIILNKVFSVETFQDYQFNELKEGN